MLCFTLLAAFAATFDDVEKATTPPAKVDALFEIVNDEGSSDDHAEAWARLAAVLDKEGHDASALIAWSHALELDPDGQRDHIEAIITLADSIGDHAIVATPMAELQQLKPTNDAESRAAYIVARTLLRDDHLGPALTWIKRVDDDSPSFADSESLRGIVLATQGNHREALAPLQTARALGGTQHRGDRYDQKLLMNVARAYYGSGNYGQSIYHYTMVPRSSEYWAEAHFERAWAHFRGGDMPGAIAVLKTHASPFFEDVWFPEAHMVRAQAMFMLCKFGAAVEEMNLFEERYKPALADLDRVLGELDADSAYDDVGAYIDGKSTVLPAPLLRPYGHEDRIAEARSAVAAYQKENTSLKGFSSHSSDLQSWVTHRVEQIRTREGRRILRRMQGERDELEGMLTGLELSRIDILQLESRLYEQAASTGKLDHGDRIGKLRNLRKTKKGFHVWPFQGEYWVDELGWFEVDARSDCPASMARKIQN